MSSTFGDLEIVCPLANFGDSGILYPLTLPLVFREQTPNLLYNLFQSFLVRNFLLTVPTSFLLFRNTEPKQANLVEHISDLARCCLMLLLCTHEM